MLLQSRLKVVVWGASRFLKVAIERKKRQVRLHSLLPILLRILAIVAMAIGAADPRLRSELAFESNTLATHRLLIVDVSMSMASPEQESSRFSLVQQQVQLLLKKATVGDSWQLVLFGTQDHPERIFTPSFQVDRVRDEIDSLEPTFQRGHLLDTLIHAQRSIEEAQPNNFEVIWLTDGQQIDWNLNSSDAHKARDLMEQISRLGKVTIVKTNSTGHDNLSIQPDFDQLPMTRRGEPCDVSAYVVNHGRHSEEIDVEFVVNGELQQTQRVQIPVGTSVQVPFQITPTQPGIHDVEFRIHDDSLAADNRAWTRLFSRGTTELLIVESKIPGTSLQASDYLTAALVGAEEDLNEVVPDVAITMSDPATFPNLDFNQFEVIVICGVSDRMNWNTAALREYVQRGGGLIVSLDSQTTIDQANTALGFDERGLLPGKLQAIQIADLQHDDPFYFEAEPSSHPIVEAFVNRPEAGFSTTRIYRYFKLAQPVSIGPELQKVVSLSNGDPLVLDQKIGFGRVVTILTGIESESGSWVLWPSFLPMIKATVSSLSSPERTTMFSTIGQPLPGSLFAHRDLRFVKNRTGEILWESSAESIDWEEINQACLRAAGIYQLESETNHILQCLIRNVDVTESDISCMTLNDLRSLPYLKGLPIKFEDGLDFATERSSLADAADAILPARWLFLVAVTLLIIDQIAGRWFWFGSGMFGGLICGASVCWLLPLSQLKIVTVLFASLALGGLLAARLRKNRPSGA